MSSSQDNSIKTTLISTIGAILIAIIGGLFAFGGYGSSNTEVKNGKEEKGKTSIQLETHGDNSPAFGIIQGNVNNK
jgi:hypothetical protein